MSNSILSYETLVHAISGSVGGVTAMSTFYPLDTVRSRLQLEDDLTPKNTLVLLKELAEKEGVETLYRGLVPVLKSLCVSNFVYFYSFHGLKKFCANKIPPSALRDLMLGSIAGVINVLSTTPLWVVNTRIKMQGLADKSKSNGNGNVVGHTLRDHNYSGLIDGLLKIYNLEGIQGLWSGTLPSLMLVINPAIQFMTYEMIKRRLSATYGSDKQFSSIVYFLVGAVAKCVATVFTYPLQLVQTKLRHGHKIPHLRHNTTMMTILEDILKKDGPKGLFKGMESKILQTILTAALMFSIYEKISAFVFRLMGLNLAKKKAV